MTQPSTHAPTPAPSAPGADDETIRRLAQQHGISPEVEAAIHAAMNEAFKVGSRAPGGGAPCTALDNLIAAVRSALSAARREAETLRQAGEALRLELANTITERDAAQAKLDEDHAFATEVREALGDDYAGPEAHWRGRSIGSIQRLRSALSAERAAREAAERDPAALKERVGEACRRVWDSARTSDDTPSGCYLVDSGPMLDLHGLMLACRASAPTPPARTEERHDG